MEILNESNDRVSDGATGTPGEVTDLTVRLGGAVITRYLIGICIAVALVVALGILGGFALIVSRALPLPIATIACIGFALTLGVVFYVLRHRRHERKRKNLSVRLATAPSYQLLKIIGEHIEDGMGNRETTVDLVGRRFLALEGGSRTIRIGPRKRRTVIRPIMVPFEPCRLDTGCEIVRAFLDAIDADSAHHETDGSPGPRDAGSPRRRSANRRFVTYMAYGFVVVYVVGGGITFATSADWKALLVFTACTAIPAIGFLAQRWYESRHWENKQPGSLSRMPESAEWFAVPAGVVLRWPAPGGQHSRVSVIGRREAVMFCIATSVFSHVWQVQIVFPDGIASRVCNALELELLLRAWLSPLHPPAADQLSDLTGDAND